MAEKEKEVKKTSNQKPAKASEKKPKSSAKNAQNTKEKKPEKNSGEKKAKKENSAPDFLEYKGKPLVRSGKTIYYGNMSDPYVVCLNIMSEEKVDGMNISGKVIVQLLDTDPSVISPKDKIIKKSEKNGLFNALDLGVVWLERALKKG